MYVLEVPVTKHCIVKCDTLSENLELPTNIEFELEAFSGQTQIIAPMWTGSLQ